MWRSVVELCHLPEEFHWWEPGQGKSPQVPGEFLEVRNVYLSHHSLVTICLP